MNICTVLTYFSLKYNDYLTKIERSNSLHYMTRRDSMTYSNQLTPYNRSIETALVKKTLLHASY
jgi:hypothetical protein